MMSVETALIGYWYQWYRLHHPNLPAIAALRAARTHTRLFRIMTADMIQRAGLQP